jgi:hypothetical protein
VWYQYNDMHINGRVAMPLQTEFYIEADSREDAIEVMKYHLNIDPEASHNGVPLYSTSEDEKLSQVTAPSRGCKWDAERHIYLEEQSPTNTFDTYTTLDDFLARDDVLAINIEETRRILSEQ